MVDVIGRLIKRWNSVRKPLVLAFSLIVFFLFGVYLFSQARITGDTASHLVWAISPILKIGAPYRDFWETKPPVWPLIVYLWSTLFGFGILSIRIINIIFAGLVVFICRLIYKRLFPTPVYEVIFFFTIIVVLSPLLNTIMLPTELLGLLLSMGALYALIGLKNGFPKFYFSGFLFFAASQTKEPFAFAVLAVIPIFFEVLLKNGFRRLIETFLQFASGILTCFVGLYIYLVRMGSVNAYIEIFRDKQTFYPLTIDALSQNFLTGFYVTERTFTEFPHGFLVLVILVALSFYFVNKFKRIMSFNMHYSRLTMKSLIITDPGLTIKYASLFYAIGSFMGFGLQNSFSTHYLIQVVVPFYILNGLFVLYLFNNVRFLFNKPRPLFYLSLFLFLFSLIVAFPKRPYISSFLPRYTKFVMKDTVYGAEKRITEITDRSQCILSVYGWGVSENYLYSMRKPCTRFFLPNMVLSDWQYKEYANDIINNPPSAILYQTLGADMDYHKFESNVINIDKIVKNCYMADTVENRVYVPKTKNIDSLKDCVKVNSI